MSQHPGTNLESSAKSLYEVTGNISDLNTLLIGVDELRAKTRSDSGAKGDVVITTNEVGQIVAVTRQDSEGRILSVIAEAAPVPPGYKLVLVPEEAAPDEPDWEDVRRQAEVSTGIKVNDHTMSIMIREVRRWIAHKSRISGTALCLPITGQKEPASMTLQQHAQPALLPLALASAPERIWLDLGFNPYEQDAHFSTFHDLTWSPDNASGHGIEYVRAKRNICATQPAQSDLLFKLWWAEYMPGATQARAWAAWCAAPQQAAPADVAGPSGDETQKLPGIVDKALNDLAGFVKFLETVNGSWNSRTAWNALRDIEWFARRKLAAAMAAPQPAPQHEATATTHRAVQTGEPASAAMPAAGVVARQLWKMMPVEPTKEIVGVMRSFLKWGWSDSENGRRPMSMLYAEILAAAPTTQPAEQFQSRVQPWMMECFGPVIAADCTERNHRFLEEALELVQATGCTQSEAHQLVDYVFGRHAGEPVQEVGGVMVTLAALCLANNIDMHDAGDTELARIWTNVEAIRAKQAAKPKHSPLPQAAPAQGDELDAARLDWLDKNIFYREMNEWDAKYVHGSACYNMWVLFAPKVAQGSARKIIDAARAAQGK